MMVFVDSFRAKISFIFLIAKSFIDIIQRVFGIFLGNDIGDGTILRSKTAAVSAQSLDLRVGDGTSGMRTAPLKTPRDKALL